MTVRVEVVPPVGEVKELPTLLATPPLRIVRLPTAPAVRDSRIWSDEFNWLPAPSTNMFAFEVAWRESSTRRVHVCAALDGDRARARVHSESAGGAVSEIRDGGRAGEGRERRRVVRSGDECLLAVDRAAGLDEASGLAGRVADVQGPEAVIDRANDIVLPLRGRERPGAAGDV